jgi:hypothetical protein
VGMVTVWMYSGLDVPAVYVGGGEGGNSSTGRHTSRGSEAFLVAD